MRPIIKTNLSPAISREQKTYKQNQPKAGFAQYLDQALDEVKFSKHAKLRLENRHIEPGPAELQRLKQGISMAREKGSRNALVLIDHLAFVVSVENNTVVTALNCNTDEKEAKVFTQIDSTVIN